MVLADYRCLECGETFTSSMECAIHHLHTKHSNFELVGTDVKMCIKS